MYSDSTQSVGSTCVLTRDYIKTSSFAIFASFFVNILLGKESFDYNLKFYSAKNEYYTDIVTKSFKDLDLGLIAGVVIPVCFRNICEFLQFPGMTTFFLGNIAVCNRNFSKNDHFFSLTAGQTGMPSGRATTRSAALYPPCQCFSRAKQPEVKLMSNILVLRYQRLIQSLHFSMVFLRTSCLIFLLFSALETNCNRNFPSQAVILTTKPDRQMWRMNLVCVEDSY